jgi:hypothetical protein
MFALAVSAVGKAGPETAPNIVTAQSPERLPSANNILAEVRANLPQETIIIQGQILSGGRLGRLERVCHMEILLELGERPARICCKLSDAFGTALEQISIYVLEDGSLIKCEYKSGNPLKSAPLPPPSNAIMNTDVTWDDLSLLFLWRTDGRTIREETLRGCACYVVEFPDKSRGKRTLWIDTQMMVLLQMDDTAANGDLRRRLTVKNIKKISDQWMIKNMAIRSYPSFHHTLIRVDAIVHGPQSTVDSQ